MWTYDFIFAIFRPLSMAMCGPNFGMLALGYLIYTLLLQYCSVLVRVNDAIFFNVKITLSWFLIK